MRARLSFLHAGPDPLASTRSLLVLLVLGVGCKPAAEPERVPAAEPDRPQGAAAPAEAPSPTATLVLGERDYFESRGLDVMVGSDFYPEGHQGGVSIIQNGLRTGANGDLRLEPTPGQWQPVPKLVDRVVDREHGEIRLRLAYPDPDKDRKGFNPIEYPDLAFAYTVRVRPDGAAFRVTVDLDEPLPDAWIGKVGFNLELFPGHLFGKSFHTETRQGIFPRQANGPRQPTEDDATQLAPLASGRRLTIAPEDDRLRMIVESLGDTAVELFDGRGDHNNGWFVVRSAVPRGATTGAIEWRVEPHAIPEWMRDPVIQVSQVGYHPAQPKHAVVELDRNATQEGEVELLRLDPEAPGTETVVARRPATELVWGEFLRYRYLRFDFGDVREPGLYRLRYAGRSTHVFQIHPEVFERHVWQPTLETFLPVQMCHMRVNDRYRVWHDACHLDDARMAPTDHNHFDGYVQGPSTLTRHASGKHVPGLDRGGWHDAGDHDLRVESQADTVYGLALAWEAFGVDYDNTHVDQAQRVVELHQPDGHPDMLQQIEHGLLSLVGAHRSLGRLYRGIITPTLRQYVLLGDPAAGTDNRVFTGRPEDAPPVGLPGSPDDNWVFTEDNPPRELAAAAGIAAGGRALATFHPQLAKDALQVAETLWKVTQGGSPADRVPLAVELLLATDGDEYRDYLLAHAADIAEDFGKIGWIVGRAVERIDAPEFRDPILAAARKHRAEVDEASRKSPYGIPYEPNIWGAGWTIQRFGARQVYLHRAFPDIFAPDAFLHALDFVLGCHPGSNTASFVSGVGANSLTVAYGINRGDESYIPGGIGSGTALIRPDYPELLEWPYLWQQTEYVLGYGTTDYLTLVLGARSALGADQSSSSAK